MTKYIITISLNSCCFIMSSNEQVIFPPPDIHNLKPNLFHAPPLSHEPRSPFPLPLSPPPPPPPQSSPVVSEEDEVSLVVEGDCSPSPKLGVMRKQGCKHPPNRVSQPCREVVENHLRVVRGHSTMALQGGRETTSMSCIQNRVICIGGSPR